jgi:phospholipid/cholesterol/gamma-HCH transport system substrate-binding protein
MKLSKEVKIALIAIIVFALTIWGYNFLKGKNIFNSTDVYYILFDRVDGLIESGNVMYQGYKVGNITALEFSPEKTQKFRVKVIIEEKIKIPLHSVVKIKQTNPLASTSDLEIVFSDETEFHRSGDTLASVKAKGLTDYIAEYQTKINNIVSSLDSVMASINQVLNTENRDKIQSSLASLDASLSNLKKSLGPQGSLNETFAHLESLSSNLEGKNQQISETLDNLSSVSSDLDSADIQATIQKLNATLLSVNLILEKIEAGEGSMGKLVNDTSLYANLDSTSYYLSNLMKDLQEHPKRYVHFSLFGKKE